MTDRPEDTTTTPTVTPACPFCGEGRGHPAFVKAGYEHFACPACASWFVDPMPKERDLADFYRRRSEESGSALCWEGTRRHLWRTWNCALKTARDSTGPGPILDIGCGAGQFLEFAARHGWKDRWGTELSAEAAAKAAAAGARVVGEDLDCSDLPAGQFALVALFDVLEHIPDPARSLRRCWELLRPGGVLALTVPHARGITMRVLRARALTVCPPEHLHYPTLAGIGRVLRRTGFDRVRADSQDVFLREWARSPRGPRSTGSGNSRAYQSLYRLATGTAFLALIEALNVPLRLAGLGDEIVAVARRPAARRDA